MRAHEFVTESKVVDKATLGGNYSAEMPSALSYPELTGRFYDMYKFGVAAAMAPDQIHDYARQSIGPDLLTLAYTEGDRAILDKAAKIMNIKSEKMNSKQSHENEDTNKTSPVAKPKKNRYGV